MLSSDVGSLPKRIDASTISDGTRRSTALLSFLGVTSDASEAFEEEVVSAFIDKLRMGIDVPNYPQFRDMNEMFFELIRGIERGGEGLLAVRSLSSKPATVIPEVQVLRQNLSRIRDEAGVDRVRIKACVTGPYTLASFFQVKSPSLFEDLGKSLAEIVSRSMFSTRYGEVAHISIDEPVLGFMNDPLLDYGSEGREALRRAWEEVCHAAASKGVETSAHLHDTSDDLYWDVEHLDMIESHVGDPLYSQGATRRRLEETDKRLKVSIAVTLFDNLIEAYHLREGFEGNIPEKIGETWTEIRHGRVDPLVFIEEPRLLRKRLDDVVERFGVERVPYACPECGMASFPSYEIAFECLRRVADTVKAFRGDRS